MEARSQLRHRPVSASRYVLRIPHWLYHNRCVTPAEKMLPNRNHDY